MNLAAKTAGVLATIALTAAPLAGAKPHGAHGNGHGSEHGQGHGPTGVGYVFKGTYADSGTVDVTKGNKHVRNAGLVGTSVSFDFSAAKISVGDTNGDGAADLADVAAGDKVVVKMKAPKSDPGEQPFAARQLVDQTHPAADSDSY
jgi:hypothetical protein